MKRSVQSLVESGQHGLVIDIECHMSNGLPNIIIVGYANKAVDEAKERIRSAFASSQLQLPRKRITINLAPADVPKDSTSFDLAIAAAILAESAQITAPKDAAVMGELGLDGSVRPIRGIIGKLLLGRELGIETFIIPKNNLDQALLVPGIKAVAVDTLGSLYKYATGQSNLAPVLTRETRPAALAGTDSGFEIEISDIIAQEQGKRAVEISAAGGHNVLLGGPPGTGKSMLAKALPSLLPPLSQQEMLEVTHIHSLASNDFDKIVTKRPFRAPHHSASNVAIMGGGSHLRPGEMSLSHRGVLLFDELPEFNRTAVEALRQPLEDRSITIARAKENATYPAHFIFVGTANPCPCGHYQTSKPCVCLPHQVIQYRRKLSGPILDRIDLYVDVHEIDNSRLLNNEPDTQEAARIKTRVAKARAAQKHRFQATQKLNADMNNKEVKQLARLDPAAKKILDEAANRFGLSARSYIRSVKVARTIADLDESATITTKHIAEALQYRPHQYHDN